MRRLPIFILLLALGCTLAFGQELTSGTLEGVVATSDGDPISGAVIPGWSLTQRTASCAGDMPWSLASCTNRLPTSMPRAVTRSAYMPPRSVALDSAGGWSEFRASR